MGTLAAVCRGRVACSPSAFSPIWGPSSSSTSDGSCTRVKACRPPVSGCCKLAHLALLAGLLLLIRWEIPGSVLTIAAALVFFAAVAGRQFPLFFGVTILPAALVLLGRLLHLRAASSPPVH